MTKRFLTTPKIVNVSSDPNTGSSGEMYYNTQDNIMKYHNGTQWVAMTGGGVGGNIDGGFPNSTYGGVPEIDGGTP